MFYSLVLNIWKTFCANFQASRSKWRPLSRRRKVQCHAPLLIPHSFSGSPNRGDQMFQKISHFFSMVIVKTFMYRSHLDQISSSVDNSSAPWYTMLPQMVAFCTEGCTKWGPYVHNVAPNGGTLYRDLRDK